ncbi:MAG TPA: hypothetical protein VGS27_20410 [Candidatus Sulfotelmatobacter sp.]|nr:hypothetical protein [Candidatus Sulfotelmatobacter sp.]
MRTPGLYAVAIFPITFLVLLSGIAEAQTLYQEEEIHVHNLPTLTAESHDPVDVLLTAVATLIHDTEVCCSEDSALHDSLMAADPESLRDVARRLDGRHLLSDGRPITVTAEHSAVDQAGSMSLINSVLDQRGALLRWNSRLYVVEGVSYLRIVDNMSGQTAYSIHKLFLWDTRFSDARRNVVFDRTIDDVTKLEGLLFVRWKTQ